jgi:hypothetical protein
MMHYTKRNAKAVMPGERLALKTSRVRFPDSASDIALLNIFYYIKRELPRRLSAEPGSGPPETGAPTGIGQTHDIGIQSVDAEKGNCKINGGFPPLSREVLPR